MFEESEKFIRLRKIFEEDGSELRKQMIYAGLILTIFERFKRYIIDQLECFFHPIYKSGMEKLFRKEEKNLQN